MDKNTCLPESKVTIVDNVVFLMPDNQEYQFPAMSIVQGWVASFKKKMENNDASFGKAAWKLCYQIHMSLADTFFFSQAGVEIGGTDTENRYAHPMRPDMVVDMSDVAIEAFLPTDKHCFQVCVLLSGLPINCRPFPVMPQVLPSKENVWLAPNYLLGQVNAATASLCVATGDLLGAVMGAKDGQITGIVAPAGRETMLAAAKGLGVIEIVPEGRPRNWLSKYSNVLYRPVSGRDLEPQIKRAQESVRRIICSAGAVGQ